MAEMKSLPANVRNISSYAIYCHLKIDLGAVITNTV